MEHRQDSRQSRLRRMVPSVGSFFTPLRLVEAFREYDEHFALSRRRYVPPNFAEMRHVLNIAQVMLPGCFVRQGALIDASGLAVRMSSSAKMQHVIDVDRKASARKLCATVAAVHGRCLYWRVAHAEDCLGAVRLPRAQVCSLPGCWAGCCRTSLQPALAAPPCSLRFPHLPAACTSHPAFPRLLSSCETRHVLHVTLLARCPQLEPACSTWLQAGLAGWAGLHARVACMVAQTELCWQACVSSPSECHRLPLWQSCHAEHSLKTSLLRPGACVSPQAEADHL